MRSNTSLSLLALVVAAAAAAACGDSVTHSNVQPSRPHYLAIEPIDPVDPGDGGGGTGGGDTGGGTGGGGATTTTDFSTYPGTITPNVPVDNYGANTFYYVSGCAQFPYVWVAPTSGNASNGVTITRVAQGSTIYFTGIVDRDTKVNFHVYNAAGQLVMTHLTQPAHDNCVVYHEPEARSTWGLPRGDYYVFASYWSYHTEYAYNVAVLREHAELNRYVSGITIY